MFKTLTSIIKSNFAAMSGSKVGYLLPESFIKYIFSLIIKPSLKFWKNPGFWTLEPPVANGRTTYKISHCLRDCKYVLVCSPRQRIYWISIDWYLSMTWKTWSANNFK